MLTESSWMENILKGHYPWPWFIPIHSILKRWWPFWPGIQKRWSAFLFMRYRFTQVPEFRITWFSIWKSNNMDGAGFVLLDFSTNRANLKRNFKSGQSSVSWTRLSMSAGAWAVWWEAIPGWTMPRKSCSKTWMQEFWEFGEPLYPPDPFLPSIGRPGTGSQLENSKFLRTWDSIP